MKEEIKNLGEQPVEAEVHAVDTGVDNGTEMQTGSPIGKFKDAQKLLDAYNELQSEFTRKCQKLSDTEKKLQEVSSIDNNQNNKDNTSIEFAWKDKVAEFLQSHNKASGMMEEIANEIVGDDNLSVTPDGLEKAYSKVIERKYIPHSELANNQEFLEKYIYSNDQIKNKIIEDYVSTIKNNQSPITITNDGFSRGVATSSKFGSLEDARSFVENMFRF
jgi:hypothetical protein